LNKEIIVQKYGGTSVQNAKRIQAIAKRVVETSRAYQGIVVVVSAMGDTTDELIKIAKGIHPSPPPREYDALVSTGENVSAALLSMAIHALGCEAISLNGGQAGIRTTAFHQRAKIDQINPKRILKELESGKIVIVSGFQGLTPDLDVATIGRGGSDTSAVAVASVLKCGVCEIYTDVDGVYTTDPRLVKDAKKLDHISYEEMLELSSLGSTVLHPRSVEFAKKHKIELHVRTSFSMEKGTIVKDIDGLLETARPVTGVALKKDEAKLSIVGVPDRPGIAAQIFISLSDEQINVDMIVQSTELDGTNNITFTISEEDHDLALKILEKVAKDIGAAKVISEHKIAKISAVGVGMISRPGVAATIFKALADQRINIQLITTSEIKVSCVVKEKDGLKALKVLHEVFELDR